jgi:hypothetical protein
MINYNSKISADEKIFLSFQVPINLSSSSKILRYDVNDIVEICQQTFLPKEKKKLLFN